MVSEELFSVIIEGISCTTSQNDVCVCYHGKDRSYTCQNVHNDQNLIKNIWKMNSGPPPTMYISGMFLQCLVVSGTTVYIHCTDIQTL